MKLKELFESEDQFLKTREEVEAWLKKLKVINYTINDDLTVDVVGNVDLSSRNLEAIQVQFGKVSGYFNCRENKLTSLQGSPREVGLDFDCAWNASLTSLKGSPEKVEDFVCSMCSLTSLVGGPKEVGRSYSCSSNKLVTLEGAPRGVGGNFFCRSNKLTSLKGAPREVSGIFSCSTNNLLSFDGMPRHVGEEFIANNVPAELVFPKEHFNRVDGLITVNTKPLNESIVPSSILAEEKLGDYFKRLTQELGIKKLGGGAFAQVFQHPEFKNMVVKVFSSKDRLYPKYLTFCRANQNNKYVPKIFDVVEYKDEDDKYTIVFMEKMKGFKSRQKFVDAMANIFTEDGKLKQRVIYDFEENLDPFDAIEDLIKIKATDKDFMKLWAFLKSMGPEALDLHRGNVMLRGSQVVFTDPVANEPFGTFANDL